ncbi:MAG TPA: beta-propeller fold lactonase family protein [Bryobacterales bacterium]|nr:beta-propeller fold lactonase family protein [Bryobacterales bacterium]
MKPPINADKRRFGWVGYLRSFAFIGGSVLSVFSLSGAVRVYVTNSAGNNVTIIDPTANKAIGEIKVSNNPHGIAASPDRSRFYISSETENVLDVVDRKTSQIIRRVPIGKRPNNIAITPDGRRVYVCIREKSCVDIVDTSSLEKVKSVEVGKFPHNVYCSADGKWMIATSIAEHKLTAIDTKSEEPVFEIPVGGVPRPLAIEAGPDGLTRRLFVQLTDLHGFVVVDFAERKVVGKVLLPDAPKGAEPLIAHTYSHGIGVSPDGKTLWVNSLLSNSVSVFSLPALKRLATIPVGEGPDWLTFTPDGRRVYVSNAGSDSVSAIATASYKELARIRVGKVPKRLIAVDVPE